MDSETYLAIAAAVVTSLSLAFVVWRTPSLPEVPEGASHRRGLWPLVLFCLGYVFAHFAVLGTPTWSGWEHQPFWIAVGLTVGMPLFLFGAGSAWPSLLVAAWVGALVFWPGVSSEWDGTTERLAALDKSIERYLRALQSADP